MKSFKKAYYFMMFFPLILTVIALFFLPDQIPAHYGADNQVTRWGSKYEALLLPLVTIPFGYFLMVMGDHSSKQCKTKDNSAASEESNKKPALITGLAALALFNVMNLFFLYTDFNQVSNLNEVPVDLTSTLFAVIGIIYIIMGCLMPKLHYNSYIGLRTNWSMKNETLWKKCQKFGGIAFIITGILQTAGCLLFFKGTAALVYFLVLSCIMAVADVVYSMYTASKY